MKIMTVQLHTTPDVVLPAGFGEFAGFKLTLTAPSGGTSTPPVSKETTWKFSGMIEAAVYMLQIECVDISGKVIMGLPVTQVTVPVTPTYTRLDNVSITWETQP